MVFSPDSWGFAQQGPEAGLAKIAKATTVNNRIEETLKNLKSIDPFHNDSQMSSKPCTILSKGLKTVNDRIFPFFIVILRKKNILGALNGKESQKHLK